MHLCLNEADNVPLMVLNWLLLSTNAGKAGSSLKSELDLHGTYIHGRHGIDHGDRG